MHIQKLLENISASPETVDFGDVISVIDSSYEFTPTRFSNGTTSNDAGQNNGSCKIFAFARLNQLDEQQTLHCFGDYYRQDVLQHPDADDHQNIRCFMQTGWSGITFSGDALSLKA